MPIVSGVLEAIIKRMIKNPNKYFTKNDGATEINNSYIMKKRKKDNITKDNILMIFLNQIPGVSDRISKTLSNEFKSLNDFMSHLSNLSNEERISFIANKEVSLNNNKKRRIGSKTSKRIVELLF